MISAEASFLTAIIEVYESEAMEGVLRVTSASLLRSTIVFHPAQKRCKQSKIRIVSL
ncbi:MAG: hypothetical protein IPH69_02025 [Bacteroidales bacterium]|nr:hypothetical protein [Bacteroidales bacterium]